MLSAEIRRAGNIDHRRRIKGGVSQRVAGVGRIEQRFEIEAAASLKVCGVSLPAPVCDRGETPQTIVPFTSRNAEGLITPLRHHNEVPELVVFSLEHLSLQRRFGACVFELREVAAKLHLQRRRTVWKTKSLQFRHNPAQDRHSFLPLLFRERRRWLIIRPFDQLTGSGNAHAAKKSFRLTDEDLFGRKINVSMKSSQLRLLGFALRAFQGKRDLGVANVEPVEKRLMIKKSGVIDIEHDFSDECERVGAVLIAENAYVPRDQSAKWIKRETADRCFDTAPVQFLHNPRPSAPAKAFPGQIPSAADRGRDDEDNGNPQNRTRQPVREGRFLTLRGGFSLRLFDCLRHYLYLSSMSSNFNRATSVVCHSERSRGISYYFRKHLEMSRLRST